VKEVPIPKNKQDCLNAIIAEKKCEMKEEKYLKLDIISD